MKPVYRQLLALLLAVVLGSALCLSGRIFCDSLLPILPKQEERCAGKHHADICFIFIQWNGNLHLNPPCCCFPI